MPNCTPYVSSSVQRFLDTIQSSVYTVVAPLKIQAWRTDEPVPFAHRRSGRKLDLKIGDSWGTLFQCAWFHFAGRVPSSAAGRNVVLLLDVNGEMCAVDARGNPVRGLTNKSSEFWRPLGEPAKTVLQFTLRARGGEQIDLWADAGCNDLFGRRCENATIVKAHIAVRDNDVHALYYDYEVLVDYLKELPKESAMYAPIEASLEKVASMLVTGFSPDKVRQARTILATILTKQGGDSPLSISAIGHAHIDLGWLWPIRETIRKGARTFSTALDLMQYYPDYIFGASQPQLFQWIKDNHPKLYSRVKQKVREGRLEPQGAMWVEADTNVSGGESLVRQILHGKRFFHNEFGVDVRHLWLPDVFGYSGALPQLLRKSGVDYFMTQKLSWNAINKFPHHSFHWQGIDGTDVLAHMLPEENYNSAAAPRSVLATERKYRDRDVSSHCLMLFGIGDGGGGPGEEHLERLKRVRNLAGLCPVVQEPAATFFERWAKESDNFATWVGELYLEKHQGTYTSHARNKRFNRRMEFMLRDVEWTSVLASTFAGTPYPSKWLDATWKEFLLYQFHDILPGSSIKRVYDECIARYQLMMAESVDQSARHRTLLAKQINTSKMKHPVVVHNSLSWERRQWAKVGRKWIQATVPSMGYTTVDMAAAPSRIPAVTAEPRLLENELLRVKFAKDGSIVSVWDKQNKRESIAAGQRANRLAVYVDKGDAWDFPLNYANQRPRHMQLVSVKPRVDGPRAVMEHVYKIGHSKLRQEVSLLSGSRRLDFATRLRWRETASMLRTSFPVAILAESATFEIQYGHVERPTHDNTTWDLAKCEVPAQKWADLSQHDYGVALLNDSKYGYKVKKNVLDLNLLRSAPYPGPKLVMDADVKPGQPHHGYSDQCDHEFTYALLPHSGGVVEGRVIQEGYELNCPLTSMKVKPSRGMLPPEQSFLTVDAPGVIVESVKKAEDSEDIVVRLYESAKRTTRTNVRVNVPVERASVTNLIEDDARATAIRNGMIELGFTPFEIKTIRLTPGR